MRAVGIIAAVLLFCAIIIIHEFGHFAAAKLSGTGVLEFSFGMGPLIFSKRKGETLYSFRAVPIGGFCRLDGETDDDDSGSSSSLQSKSAPVKIAIFAAGAFMNILLCVALLTCVFFYAGSMSNIIDSVTPGGPAEAAGIMPGDIVVAVGGAETSSWTDTVAAIASSEGSFVVTVERDGALVDIETVAEYSAETGRKIIGVSCRLVRSLPKAFRYSLSTCGEFFRALREFIVRLFTGKVASNEVVGVVGMASMVGEQTRYGVASVIYLMAILSLNIGCVNLLPLPALDGGRILFVIIRAIFRGRISDEAEGYVHAAGMIALLALMAVLIFKDTLVLLR